MAYTGSTSTTSPVLSNLAVNKSTGSKAIVQFLEGLTEERVEFNASEYDAVIGFFEGRDYTRESAKSIGYISPINFMSPNTPVSPAW